jgi:hypothetical protein
LSIASTARCTRRQEHLNKINVFPVPDGSSAEDWIRKSATVGLAERRLAYKAPGVDGTRKEEYAARLTHLASHDALTGLPIRREFENRLRAALERPQDTNYHHAVLYLDIDQFKIVNDTCGHAAGDELLRQVSILLRPGLRAGEPSRAWAATSSACCSSTARPSRRCGSRKACGAPSRTSGSPGVRARFRPA